MMSLNSIEVMVCLNACFALQGPIVIDTVRNLFCTAPRRRDASQHGCHGDPQGA